ncbi:unnamed protein product [Vitrella brassicaformis CCMP3155]|uniref:Uncharacterized protein n=2 Tax=Vitrella brassicaformis TaxID=1169539 RepID=A0A0G4EL47_VITBC|nr:unnamed protein product [Vitrella brassicaformis CCMP3155]|eukprot:CEL97719.1 unnamed protein product [Vitrella brassicaformis CCMP3155]
MAGVLVSLQLSTSSRISKVVGSPVYVSTSSYTFSLLILGGMAVSQRSPWHLASVRPAYLIGGFLVSLSFLSIPAAPHLGVELVMIVMTAGEMLGALVIDRVALGITSLGTVMAAVIASVGASVSFEVSVDEDILVVAAYVALMFGVGTLFPLLSFLNTELSRQTHSGVKAAFLSSCVTTITMFGLSTFVWLAFHQHFTPRLNQWWLWLIDGGCCAFYVFTITLVPKRIGFAPCFILIVLGKMVGGLICDTYGILVKPQAITPRRILGVILVTAGACIYKLEWSHLNLVDPLGLLSTPPPARQPRINDGDTDDGSGSPTAECASEGSAKRGLADRSDANTTHGGMTDDSPLSSSSCMRLNGEGMHIIENDSGPRAADEDATTDGGARRPPSSSSSAGIVSMVMMWGRSRRTNKMAAASGESDVGQASQHTNVLAKEIPPSYPHPHIKLLRSQHGEGAETQQLLAAPTCLSPMVHRTRRNRGQHSPYSHSPASSLSPSPRSGRKALSDGGSSPFHSPDSPMSLLDESTDGWQPQDSDSDAKAASGKPFSRLLLLPPKDREREGMLEQGRKGTGKGSPLWRSPPLRVLVDVGDRGDASE